MTFLFCNYEMRTETLYFEDKYISKAFNYCRRQCLIQIKFKTTLSKN